MNRSLSLWLSLGMLPLILLVAGCGDSQNRNVAEDADAAAIEAYNQSIADQEAAMAGGIDASK